MGSESNANLQDPDLVSRYIVSIRKTSKIPFSEREEFFKKIIEKENELLVLLSKSVEFASFFSKIYSQILLGDLSKEECFNKNFGYHPEKDSGDDYQQMIENLMADLRAINSVYFSIGIKKRFKTTPHQKKFSEIFILLKSVEFDFSFLAKFVETSSDNCIRSLYRETREMRTKFIESNLRLVVKVAKKYYNTHLTLMDMIQEGNLGLMKAMDKFDPNRGYKFSTYAIWWIRQSINRALENKSNTVRLPAHMFRKKLQYNRILNQNTRSTDSDQKMMEKLGVSDVEYKRIQDANEIHVKSLQDPIADQDGTILEDLIAGSASDPIENISDQELSSSISELITKLKEKESAVLRMRFGLENVEPKSLRDIGKEFGVSGERVRQIELGALKSLRKPYRKGKLSPFYEL